MKSYSEDSITKEEVQVMIDDAASRAQQSTRDVLSSAMSSVDETQNKRIKNLAILAIALAAANLVVTLGLHFL